MSSPDKPDLSDLLPPTDQPSPADLPPPTDAGNEKQAREKTSGRVAFDARGNAVWEWRTSDKTFAKDVSTTLVEKLEAPELGLATTAIVKKPKNSTPEKAPESSGGTGRDNPYNHSATDVDGRTRTPYAKAMPRKPATDNKTLSAKSTSKSSRSRGGFFSRLLGKRNPD